MSRVLTLGLCSLRMGWMGVGVLALGVEGVKPALPAPWMETNFLSSASTAVVALAFLTLANWNGKGECQLEGNDDRLTRYFADQVFIPFLA